jgi:tRNA nucleotidyltransferase (CCA-adding enzyme)
VGKPRSRAFSDKTNDYTFYEHERIGAEIAHPILTRLKFSNDERDRVTNLVRHHLICYSDDWTDGAVRRWLRRVGTGIAEDLYRLGRADALGKGRTSPTSRSYELAPTSSSPRARRSRPATSRSKETI